MTKFIEAPPLGEQKRTETLVNSWYVQAGQKVNQGDDLVELVTDKAAFNLPAPEACRIVKILVKEGVTIKQGDRLVEIEV